MDDNSFTGEEKNHTLYKNNQTILLILTVLVCRSNRVTVSYNLFITHSRSTRQAVLQENA